MCDGALARFTAVNRAVVHCINKVGHPGIMGTSALCNVGTHQQEVALDCLLMCIAKPIKSYVLADFIRREINKLMLCYIILELMLQFSVKLKIERYFCFHTDIDECTEESDNCDDNAICTNTDGSFTCECESGFSGNGVQCDGKIIMIMTLVSNKRLIKEIIT